MQFLTTHLPFIISAISLGLGIYSVHYAFKTSNKLNRLFGDVFESFKRTNAELNSTADNINSLCHILETRKLGVFPENMNEINKLVDSADSKIEIFVDYFAYGLYSHPKIFSKYYEVLRRKISVANNSENSLSIEIYCYSDKLLNIVNEVIFKELSWDEIKNSERFKNYYSFYQNGNFNNSREMVEQLNQLKSKEDFLSYLVEHNRKYIQLLFPDNTNGLPQSKNVSLKKTNTEFPCFLWIKDDEEIILSFAGYRNNTGRCIQTKDKELLDLVRSELKATYRYE